MYGKMDHKHAAMKEAISKRRGKGLDIAIIMGGEPHDTPNELEDELAEEKAEQKGSDLAPAGDKNDHGPMHMQEGDDKDMEDMKDALAAHHPEIGNDAAAAHASRRMSLGQRAAMMAHMKK